MASDLTTGYRDFLWTKQPWSHHAYCTTWLILWSRVSFRNCPGVFWYCRLNALLKEDYLKSESAR